MRRQQPSAENQDISKLYSLVLLGTDTDIEEEGDLAPGYERGETLSGLYRRLCGVAFKDKHIVHGAVTDGTDTDQRAAEAIVMAIKAISEGKTTIKVAAHSRGGIESFLFAHALEKIINLLKDKDCNENNIQEKLRKLNLGYVGKAVKDALKFENGKMKFTSTQTKIDTKAKTKKKTRVDTTPHEIKIDDLLKNAKQNDVNCELFVIDPVPGQKLVSSWVEEEFFEVPKIVKKLQLIYLNDERTSYFEPVVPQKIHEQCEFVITTLPGHHGTASGFLNEQGAIDSKLIGVDEDPEKNQATAAATTTAATTTATATAATATSASTTTGSTSPKMDATKKRDPSPKPKKRAGGKKTRHVQKITISKLIDFFGTNAFNKQVPDSDVSTHPRGLRIVSDTISRCIEHTDKGESDEYRKKMYDKIVANSAEYGKFRGTKYAWLPSGATRRILTATRGDYIREYHAYPGLHAPLIPGYVNDEHIRYSIGNLRQQLQMQADLSIAKVINDFASLFLDTKANKTAIDNLYQNDGTASKYKLYFYELVGGFISSSVQKILEGDNETDKRKRELADAIKAKESLSQKMTKYEQDTKSKVHVAVMIDEIWSAIIQNLGITPLMAQVSAQCTEYLNNAMKQLVSMQSNQLFASIDPAANQEIRVSIEALEDKIQKIEKGLVVLREAQLIDDTLYKSYVVGSDALKNTIALAKKSEESIVAALAARQRVAEDSASNSLQIKAESLVREQEAFQSLQQAMKMDAERRERELQSEVSNLSEEKVRAERMAAQLSKRVTTLEQEIGRVQAISNQKHAELDNLQRSQQQLIAQHEARVQQLQATVISKQQAVDDLTQQRLANQASLDKLNKGIDELRQTHAGEIDKQRAERDQSNQNYAQTAAAHAAELARIQAELDERQQQVNVLNQQNAANAAQAQQALKELTDASRVHAQQLESLRAEREQSSQMHEQSAAVRGAELQRLQAELANKRQEVIELTQQRAANAVHAQQLNQALEELRQVHVEELARVNADREQLVQNNERLQAELQRLRAELAVGQQQVNVLNQQQAANQAQVQQAAQALAEARRAHEEEIGRQRAEREQLAQSHAQAAAAHAVEIERLRADLANRQQGADLLNEQRVANEEQLRLAAQALAEARQVHAQELERQRAERRA